MEQMELRVLIDRKLAEFNEKFVKQDNISRIDDAWKEDTDPWEVADWLEEMIEDIYQQVNVTK